MNGIPVLMYHALEDDRHPTGLKGPGAQLYTVHTGAFRDQMRFLKEQGYRALLLNDVSEPTRQEKTVVLTFDDGHRSNITLALPILRDFGFPAEFFVTTGWIGQPNYMTTGDIRGLVKSGMGVGSHGVRHAFMDELSETDALQELVASRDTLIQMTRRPVQWFSAPGGRLRPGLELLAAQAGFSGVCTSAPGLFRSNMMHMRVPRMAVRGTTSMSAFARLVRQPPYARVWAASRHTTLAAVKYCVGNDRYVRLHEWVSKVAIFRKPGAQ